MNALRRIFSHILVFGLLLGVHNGYIALWKEPDPEPWKVFPYKASLLPGAEQLLLERGIPIRDENHLHRLLEEYLS